METQSRRVRTRPVDRRLQLNSQFSASPWREAVRKACVDRAKKKRRDLLWKHRQTGLIQEEPILRNVVEEELGRHGVAVVSPGHMDSVQNSTTISMSPPTPLELDFEETNMRNAEEELSDHHPEPYYLSEEELYELMQEVANEVDDNYDALLEAALELEQLEFEAQVAEFEQWEANGEEEELICPVCSIGHLHISEGKHELNCSNRACCLQQYALSNDSLTLNSLRDRLVRSYEYHSITCHQPLSVQLEMQTSTGRPLLAGTCASCGIRMEI